MPLVGGSFINNTSQANFSRDIFATLDEMKNYNTRRLPEMYIASCIETKKIYLYNKENTVDANLGKWREISGSKEKPLVTPFAVPNLDDSSLENYNTGDYLFYYDTLIKEYKFYLLTKTREEDPETHEETYSYSLQDVTDLINVLKIVIENDLYDLNSNIFSSLDFLWLVK